jgi:hypothetical protein
MSGAFDFSRLYRVGDSMRGSALRVVAVSPDIDLEEIQTGEVRPEGAIEFRWDSGKTAFDLIGTSQATFLLSRRFIAALERVCATGYDCMPVKIVDRIGIDIQGYSLLVVKGRSGPLDREMTRIERVSPPVPNGADTYEARGWYFPPASWDQSDIFAPAKTSAVCVTERVYRELKASKLTNVSFTRLSDALVNIHRDPPPGRNVVSTDK